MLRRCEFISLPGRTRATVRPCAPDWESRGPAQRRHDTTVQLGRDQGTPVALCLSTEIVPL
eukprot:991554-Prymnesium_polylepis.1